MHQDYFNHIYKIYVPIYDLNQGHISDNSAVLIILTLPLKLFVLFKCVFSLCLRTFLLLNICAIKIRSISYERGELKLFLTTDIFALYYGIFAIQFLVLSLELRRWNLWCKYCGWLVWLICGLIMADMRKMTNMANINPHLNIMHPNVILHLP